MKITIDIKCFVIYWQQLSREIASISSPENGLLKERLQWHSEKVVKICFISVDNWWYRLDVIRFNYLANFKSISLKSRGNISKLFLYGSIHIHGYFICTVNLSIEAQTLSYELWTFTFQINLVVLLLYTRIRFLYCYNISSSFIIPIDSYWFLFLFINDFF